MKKLALVFMIIVMLTFSSCAFIVLDALLSEEETSTASETVSEEQASLPAYDEDFIATQIDSTDPSAAGDSSELTRGSGLKRVESDGQLSREFQAGITKGSRAVLPLLKRDVYGAVLDESFFFYRNLLNSNERALYDRMCAAAMKLETTFPTSVRLNAQQVDNVFTAFLMENPDLFWVDANYRYTYNADGVVTSVTLGYNRCADDLATHIAAFNACADSVLEVVMGFESDLDKVKYIHDLLLNLNDYAYADLNQSAYSALCLGETVCAGYAKAFSYFCQRLSIPSVVVIGYAGEAHAWNIVELDGGWYVIDCTWDDPVGNPANYYYYNYFNVTDAQISDTHTRDAVAVGLPQANATAYAFENLGYGPGSDFSEINYGHPRTDLPFVYIDRDDLDPDTSGADGDGIDADLDTEEAYEDYYHDDEPYYDFYTWTDEEWEDFWAYMEEGLPAEMIETMRAMEWDEFMLFLEEMVEIGNQNMN
jgi:hypothetical protein